MQVNSREIEVKRNFKSLFYLNQKSSGFFDEVNNIFYLATQTNYTSIQISVFNSLNLNYINSFFIYNEMLPFIDNSLTIDNNNQIILITTNNIIKIKIEINYLNKDQAKLKIIKKQLLPSECIIPSSSVLNLDRNLLLLGCVSTYGMLYEINLNSLKQTNKHTFYYGSSIDALLLGPINSFTFLEGTLNYPYHLVSFTFKDITSSSSNTNGNSIYRNRETYFGQAYTASSDLIKYGLYAFGHDILLFDLTEISNTPKDIDYINDCISTSSTYSPESNSIIISTNSSLLHIYHLPSNSNILKSINSKSLFIFLPIIIIITIVCLVFLTKYIYSLYFKKKPIQNENEKNGYIEF
ncbi:hypothetical protein DICPUDRAFT_99220 [Dictyostelium purpureum]|uniref:Uncharacterized protein n=1 Tax=Dictyostelium purpureum TaxID=5786 RepID=F0ZXA1_DICPU|nr:uncharacterized protein DICPUDRAFT_99220 [Dictyostelium purpureum]EGC31412.1 hypothetical protein DICPUDRAFT_99220 [Dictyostelium purpureum]|eukprot:XP_003292045.1 hypothetical protein DICPUDRAFT_99220 [Dictyostelium purpureum]